ncbi:hypothetical protein S2M10_34010 [Sphingomonas sp. S2M10]|nr:hypothetical protein [Sphingomonas sp. S2M10]
MGTGCAREQPGAFVVVMRLVAAAVVEQLRCFGRAIGFIERDGRGLEVDQRHLFVARDLAHRLGIVGQRAADAAGIEVAPFGRGDQHRRAAAPPHLGDIGVQPGGVGDDRVRIGLRPFRFLIVMSELDQHPIASLYLRQELVEAKLGDEGLQRLARFCMIGHGDVRLEQRRQHLAPAGGGFGALIRDGGIAREKDGGDRHRLDRDSLDVRIAKKLQRELVVPGKAGRLARLEPHGGAARRVGGRRGQRGSAHVHDEAGGHELPRGGGDAAQHQSTRFRLHRGARRCAGVA